MLYNSSLPVNYIALPLTSDYPRSIRWFYFPVNDRNFYEQKRGAIDCCYSLKHEVIISRHGRY
jgi:hypothetical protein